MHLILWRHAEAEAGVNDMERQLTTKGAHQATKMAAFLRPRLPNDTCILASPALRTQQTAQALKLPFQTLNEIAPGANARTLLHACGWPDLTHECIVVVGHQPVLGEAAALLLSGLPSSWSIKKGAIWWFTRRQRNGGFETQLRLALSPDVL